MPTLVGVVMVVREIVDQNNEFKEFSEALDNLFMAIVEELKLYELMDWLTRQLQRFSRK